MTPLTKFWATISQEIEPEISCGLLEKVACQFLSIDKPLFRQSQAPQAEPGLRRFSFNRGWAEENTGSARSFFPSLHRRLNAMTCIVFQPALPPRGAPNSTIEPYSWRNFNPHSAVQGVTCTICPAANFDSSIWNRGIKGDIFAPPVLPAECFPPSLRRLL